MVSRLFTGKRFFLEKETKKEKKLTFTPFHYYVEGKLEKFENTRSQNISIISKVDIGVKSICDTQQNRQFSNK
jgi:hypothetical protein